MNRCRVCRKPISGKRTSSCSQCVRRFRRICQMTPEKREKSLRSAKTLIAAHKLYKKLANPT